MEKLIVDLSKRKDHPERIQRVPLPTEEVAATKRMAKEAQEQEKSEIKRQKKRKANANKLVKKLAQLVDLTETEIAEVLGLKV